MGGRGVAFAHGGGAVNRQSVRRMAIQRSILIPPFQLQRKAPMNLVDADRVYFEGELRRSCDGVTLVECAPAVLDVHKGVVIHRRKVCPESLVHPDLVQAYGLAYVFRQHLKPRSKIGGGPFLVVHTSYCEGYGHWMSDAIPRLFLVRDILNIARLLLPDNYTRPFYRESLLPFGLDPDKDVEYVPRSVCEIERVICPSHAGPTFCNVKDSVLQEIRELYQAYFGLGSLSPRRRIYVSRAKTDRRYLLNEEELLSVLRKYDFEVVHFQDHTFADQLRIAASCSILVGLTGSGLNNMMFMKAGAKVVEFKMRGDYQNLHYFGFASGLGLPYYYVLCDGKGDNRFDSNFIIDISGVRSALEHALKR